MAGLLGRFVHRNRSGRTLREDDRSIVPNAVLGLIDVASQVGQPAEVVLAGSRWSVDDLRRRGARVSWVDLVTCLENLERAGLTVADFEDLGRRMAGTRELFVQQIASFFVRPEHFMFVGLRILGPSFFPPVEAEGDFRGRDIRFSLSVPDQFRPCAAYFHICRGTFEGIPTVIGYPPAMVQAEIGPRRGDYEIRIAGEVRGLAGLRRIASAVLSAPRVIRVLAEQQDDLRASFEQTVETQRRFRDIIDALPDAVILHRGGKIVYVNPVLPVLLGYDDAAALVGTPWVGLVHPEERATAGAGREHRFQHTDGSSVVLELSAEQQVALEGKDARMLVARDVTARHELQQHLALTDRMASLGTIAAGIAHEINNPLTLVMTNLELAARASAEPRVRELLAGAAEGAARVRDIVGDLRIFARPDDESAPARERVDLGEIVRSTIALARGQAGQRTELVTHIDEVPAVSANRGRIGQVVLNLVLNAVDALPDRPAARNRIDVSVTRDAAGVAVEVADNGAGIPAEIQARVFEPFFTTKAGGGSGLGLAVARNIVESYGGEMSFTSEPGHGATFRVVLPVAEGRAEVGPRPGSAPVTRRGRVLVVDDEELVRRVIEQALSDSHDVVLATSGNDAIRRLGDAEPFDAVLCDIMMRDGTGVDVHAWIARERPELVPRLVFMTGGTYRPETRTFMASVTNPCLEKPFTIEQLSEIIERTVGAGEPSVEAEQRR